MIVRDPFGEEKLIFQEGNLPSCRNNILDKSFGIFFATNTHIPN